MLPWRVASDLILGSHCRLSHNSSVSLDTLAVVGLSGANRWLHVIATSDTLMHLEGVCKHHDVCMTSSCVWRVCMCVCLALVQYISVIGYSRFVAFNPDCAVHTAITDVVSYQSLTCYTPLQFVWASAVPIATVITWVIAVCNVQLGLKF